MKAKVRTQEYSEHGYNFMSIEANDDSGIGFYCDKTGEYYFISVLMAKHIIKRFNQYKALKTEATKIFKIHTKY